MMGKHAEAPGGEGYEGFENKSLGARHGIHIGSIPEALLPTREEFDEIWGLHPDAFVEILIHGRWVNTPRWQKAYEKDYYYSRQINLASPAPPVLRRYLDWGRGAIDPRLNGLLLNWYEGKLGHYIGPHRDDTANMVPGTPIVTISLGAERPFRVHHPDLAKPLVLPATNGRVFIMPFSVNQAAKHEVSRRANGRRISLTLRALDPVPERLVRAFLERSRRRALMQGLKTSAGEGIEESPEEQGLGDRR